MIITSHQETYSGQYVTSKDHPSPNTIGPPLIKKRVVDSSYPDEMCAMMGVSAGEVSYSGIPLTYKTTTTSGTCVTNTEYEIYPFSFFTNSLVIAGITLIPVATIGLLRSKSKRRTK